MCNVLPLPASQELWTIFITADFSQVEGVDVAALEEYPGFIASVQGIRKSFDEAIRPIVY